MNVGWKDAEVRHQVLDVVAVRHPDPGLDAAALDDPGEHVCQRQEQQGARRRH